MSTKRIFGRHLLCATALCVSLAAMPAHAAEAADAAAADAAEQQSADGGLSEIIVTAEKRETDLQKTPISIAVLGEQDLENRHVQSLLDLTDGAAPGLRVTPYASRPFSLILNIRGVGIMQDTNQPAADSGVGVYVDGVYLGRPQGLNAALYDVESIEVLKGPQGTLFGRNTEGGALNIVTKKPSGELHLGVTAGLGNFGSYEGEVHLDLPEWHNLSVKVDGVVNGRDGFVDNPLVGAMDFGAVKRRGIHAQLQWQPAPNFTANYSFDASHEEDGTSFPEATIKDTTPKTRPPLFPLLTGRLDVSPIGIPLAPSIGHQAGHTLNLKWDVAPELTIKSISSYRDLYQNQFQNSPVGTFTPNAKFGRFSLAAFDQYQYSQELQAIGETGRLKYVFGALGYHEDVRDQAQAFNTMQYNADGTAASVLPVGPAVVATTAVDALYPYAPVDRASHASTTSFGLYGQATWTPPVLNDILHLTGGLRWTKDRKRGELLIVNNALPVDEFGVSRVLEFKKSWSKINPLVNIAIDVTPDAQVYGKWTSGYRSGGANSRSLSYKPFNPESVSMFEIGAKTEFLDHHVRFNIAAYTGTYKDYQVEFSGPYYSYDAAGNVITTASTTRTTSDTINAPGTGRVSGVEAELMVAPVRGLTLSGTYTYNYVRIPASANPFPSYVPGRGMVADPTLLTIYPIYTPRHSATGAIDYEYPANGFTVRAHIDGNWNGGYYSTAFDPSSAVKAIKTQPGVVFNARLSVADIELASSGATMTVALWARNLFNEEHFSSRRSSATNGITGAYNDPRTFGVQGSVKF